MANILIADSGATKCEWVLLKEGKKSKTVLTQGISPYFLSADQIVALIQAELLSKLKNVQIDAIYYYGTGLLNPDNIKLLKKVLKKIFPDSDIEATDDMYAVARATCGAEKGIACILGTGSNSCYFNGKKIIERRTGIGYILGDEGSGAYLGKKVLQYFLYKTFDEELTAKFVDRFHVDSFEVIDHVYRKPLPNKYIASFAIFLAENRGHYMIENIIEDGLNDFIVTHLYKLPQAWSSQIHFSGSIAYGFRDILTDLCQSYELSVGKIIKEPMKGLIEYHRNA